MRVVVKRHGMSVRRACRLVGLSKASWYYRALESAKNAELRVRLRELAKQRPAFGSPRLTVLVHREYGGFNQKRVERRYAEEGLQLPRRAKRQRGSVDFAHDILADGRRTRVLVVVDDFTRECLALEMDTSISGQRVSRIVDAVRRLGKLPQVLVCDNESELTSRRHADVVRGARDIITLHHTGPPD